MYLRQPPFLLHPTPPKKPRSNRHTLFLFFFREASCPSYAPGGCIYSTVLKNKKKREPFLCREIYLEFVANDRNRKREGVALYLYPLFVENFAWSWERNTCLNGWRSKPLGQEQQRMSSEFHTDAHTHTHTCLISFCVLCFVFSDTNLNRRMWCFPNFFERIQKQNVIPFSQLTHFVYVISNIHEVISCFVFCFFPCFVVVVVVENNFKQNCYRSLQNTHAHVMDWKFISSMPLTFRSTKTDCLPSRTSVLPKLRVQLIHSLLSLFSKFGLCFPIVWLL